MNYSASEITSRLRELRASLPEDVSLVAVSKFHPASSIRDAYLAGQRIFGESRVQELETKVVQLADCPEIKWHFIGHLQSNKTAALLKCRPALIQSVDTEKILRHIDRLASDAGFVQNVLMQVHVAREETKFGFLPEELLDFFNRRQFETLKAVHICGIMGMASNTDDTSVVKSDFTRIRDIFLSIRSACPDLRGFDTLSMGMSHDWHLAVECGSDMVRIGSAIFGERLP